MIVDFRCGPVNLERLEENHQKIISNVYYIWSEYIESLPENERTIVDYFILSDLLKGEEKEFVEDLFLLKPKVFGFNGPFFSLESPYKLLKIDSYQFESGRESGVQYCPDDAYYDYLELNAVLLKETGKSVVIDSGYRSAGRQAFVFIRSVVTEKDYSVTKTAKMIAFPGYSEHGAPVNTAIDFSTTSGINGFSDDQKAEDFEATEEYDWLMKNADKFNFYLSYPRDNEFGVGYEPWHWHWEIKEDK